MCLLDDFIPITAYPRAIAYTLPAPAAVTPLPLRDSVATSGSEAATKYHHFQHMRCRIAASYIWYRHYYRRVPMIDTIFGSKEK